MEVHKHPSKYASYSSCCTGSFICAWAMEIARGVREASPCIGSKVKTKVAALAYYYY